MVGTSMNSGASPIDGFTGGHDLMVALYGVGQHNFGFTISDFRVFGVGSNNPPTANAGLDRTEECTSPTGSQVTLDSTNSTDPDGDALTYSWTGSFGTVSGATPTITLPLGSHTITLTVDDGKNSGDTILNSS